jgi:glycosyltransferase involved in cell wall biosynthesis
VNENPALSIVVPVYNEEDGLLALYAEIKRAAESLGISYEIVFTDDGSRDRTFELLKAVRNQDSLVKVVRFRRNFGQTAAMAAGFDHARGEVIVSMDGDLQNDPADIPVLLKKLEEGFDVVCGWRKNRQDKFWSRRLPSVLANWIIGLVTGVKIHDNGCSLKAYRGSVIKKVTLYGEMHRFIPAMATQADARIAEIVVNHHPRRFGKSKYGIGRAWRVMLDIVTVKMITGFAARPMLWFGHLGSLFLVLSLATVMAEISDAEIIPEEWTVMYTAAFSFFFLGLHLLGLGIIGELTTRTGDFIPVRNIVQAAWRKGTNKHGDDEGHS